MNDKLLQTDIILKVIDKKKRSPFLKYKNNDYLCISINIMHITIDTRHQLLINQ